MEFKFLSLILFETYGDFRVDSTDFWDKMSLHDIHYPEKLKGKCGAILAMNLASPEWTTVGCFEELKPPILCEFFGNNSGTILGQRVGDLNIFQFNCIVHFAMCFEFVADRSNKTFGKRKDIFIFKHLQEFEHLFGAISEPFPPVLDPEGEQAFTYHKHGAYFHYVDVTDKNYLKNVLY